VNRHLVVRNQSRPDGDARLPSAVGVPIGVEQRYLRGRVRVLGEQLRARQRGRVSRGLELALHVKPAPDVEDERRHAE
jgi:hypothetical protein